MATHKCKTCGGDLVLTIGSDTAFCGHCGQAAAVDLQDVKKYQDVYQSAEALMRTDTLPGYADALTRLQSISFIPQAKEKAELCEKRMKQLRQSQDEKAHLKNRDEAKTTKLGVIITVFAVLFLLAAVAGVVYAAYHLVKGDLSQTEIIVIASVAAAFVLMLIVSKVSS